MPSRKFAPVVQVSYSGVRVDVLLLVEHVDARGEALIEEIRLGERRRPAPAVLAVRRAELHVLAAAEEVRFRERNFGDHAFRRRIAARQADRTRRLVFDRRR